MPWAARGTAAAIPVQIHAVTEPEGLTAWAKSIADPVKREATLRVLRKR